MQGRTPSGHRQFAKCALHTSDRGRRSAPSNDVLAARDGRQDRYPPPIIDRSVQAIEEANVLAAEIHVHKAPERAALIGQALAELVIALVQAVQDLAHGGAFELSLALPAGGSAKLGWDLDRDAHSTQPLAPANAAGVLAALTGACSTSASNCSTDGSISWDSKVPRTASSVFSPSPVITSTTRSSGSMPPRAASFASTAVVTPPAVSVKTPVVCASSAMPSRISWSETESIEPPLFRAISSAYGPSAGLPIASDLAIVLGFTGLQMSWPLANAVAIGEQPSAWAPFILGRSPSTSPSSRHSSKPLAIFVNSDPDALGAMTRSGSSKPSCSAISYASVFDPSA